MAGYTEILDQRWSDLSTLLFRGSPLTPSAFEPGPELRNALMEGARVLVVGAGGLGCEILKDLALSGFKNIHVIDLDRIDITNLNRQFLFRRADVGQYKAEVAARFIMQRVPGCTVTAYTTPIQNFDADFYRDFHIVIAGLDNVQARRWLNSMLHSLVEFDAEGEPLMETVRPMIDGGTEGFKGQARLILPFKNACYECTLGDLPKQTTFQFCTIAETPRLPEHCIQYAYVIEWEKHHGSRKLDTDSAEDMTWVYERAKERGELFGIQGVTYMLTMGVVKNIIPAIASTNALISAACVLEALKVATYISHPVDNYMMYMGQSGIHVHTFQYESNPNCLICSRKPVALSLTPATTLQQFFETISAQLQLAGPSASSSNGVLYIRKPAALEQLHHYKLELTFEQLLAKGLYTTGEPIIITDSSIEGSVTLNVTFAS